MSTPITVTVTIITSCIGIPVFIAGLLGEILNIIVFLSLQTFRQSSCAFYLTTMSIFNIGQLFSGLFVRIMMTLFNIDGTQNSLFYCKFRPYCFQLCTISSLMCFCLATFDQYCATSSHPRLQQWCTIKLAKRLAITNFIVWSLQGIPYLVLYQHILSPTTNQVTCTSTNLIFAQYRAYVIIMIFMGILPILIAISFGLMAYRNVQQLSYRTIPLVRRELDKQLTKMVLVQVIVNFFTLLPQTIVNTLYASPSLINNSGLQTILQFVYSITALIYYVYFGSSFYIYICASERFRKQLIYVFFKIHLNRQREQIIFINQVKPEIQINNNCQ